MPDKLTAYNVKAKKKEEIQEPKLWKKVKKTEKGETTRYFVCGKGSLGMALFRIVSKETWDKLKADGMPETKEKCKKEGGGKKRSRKSSKAKKSSKGKRKSKRSSKGKRKSKSKSKGKRRSRR